MNCYFLIDANKLEEAKTFAPSTGAPSQLFQYTISPDGTKAVVQADWSEEGIEWLSKNGVYLGRLLENGLAEQSVYNELAKPEWQIQEV